MLRCRPLLTILRIKRAVLMLLHRMGQLWRSDTVPFSKGEIINQIKFYLKKHCFVSQLFLFFCFFFWLSSWMFCFWQLSGSKLIKRDVSKVELLIKALLKCQKQLDCIGKQTSKEIKLPFVKSCDFTVVPFLKVILFSDCNMLHGIGLI